MCGYVEVNESISPTALNALLGECLLHVHVQMTLPFRITFTERSTFLCNINVVK